MIDGSLRVRNVYLSGRRTSIRLEPAMWEALERLAGRGQTVHKVLTDIQRQGGPGSFTARVRVYLLLQSQPSKRVSLKALKAIKHRLEAAAA